MSSNMRIPPGLISDTHIQHLHRIQANSNINRMSSNNLAICFGCARSSV